MTHLKHRKQFNKRNDITGLSFVIFIDTFSGTYISDHKSLKENVFASSIISLKRHSFHRNILYRISLKQSKNEEIVLIEVWLFENLEFIIQCHYRNKGKYGVHSLGFLWGNYQFSYQTSFFIHPCMHWARFYDYLKQRYYCQQDIFSTWVHMYLIMFKLIQLEIFLDLVKDN